MRVPFFMVKKIVESCGCFFGTTFDQCCKFLNNLWLEKGDFQIVSSLFPRLRFPTWMTTSGVNILNGFCPTWSLQTFAQLSCVRAAGCLYVYDVY